MTNCLLGTKMWHQMLNPLSCLLHFDQVLFDLNHYFVTLKEKIAQNCEWEDNT